MSSYKSVQSQVRSIKNPSTSGQPKPSAQPSKSIKHSSAVSHGRQAHTSVQATGRATECASSSSPSSGQVTNLGPSARSLSGALATIKSLHKTAAQRGQPLFATYYEPPSQPSPDDEPLDHNIEGVLRFAKNPEGHMGYNNFFRAGIYQYVNGSFEDGQFTDKYDAHIRQLVRCMDELRRTGECRIGNKMIRP
jgi:hypothetical protein